MTGWYVDEGIATLEKEWKKEHPGAVVYKIADDNHSTNPDVTQHAPDRGGRLPGDDKGEVDAADFMPGKGNVSRDDLYELFTGLHRSRDKRLLYVIFEDQIFSSVTSPWHIRKYNGAFHTHVHVSVNDLFDNNQSDWQWEKMVAREIEYVPVPGAKLPLLQAGDEDTAQDGWNHVARAQVLANWMENKTPDLDVDGVYGANTAKKFAKLFGGNGLKLPLAHIKQLHGIS
jgi:hypothetical protein